MSGAAFTNTFLPHGPTGGGYSTPRSHPLRLFKFVLAIPTIVPVLVMLGWLFKIETAKSIAPGLIAMKSLKLEGFIVFEHLDRRDQITAGLVELVEAGKLTIREDIIEGLENAPAALSTLFAGENLGKRLVRVAAPTGA